MFLLVSQSIVKFVGNIDMFKSAAKTALTFGYVRPNINMKSEKSYIAAAVDMLRADSTHCHDNDGEGCAKHMYTYFTRLLEGHSPVSAMEGIGQALAGGVEVFASDIEKSCSSSSSRDEGESAIRVRAVSR